MTATTGDLNDDLMSVYLRQWRTLRSFLARRTGSQDLAEDALQETWLRLSGMDGGTDAIRDRQAFILRVAGNIAIDLVRRERRHTIHCVSDEALFLAAADTSPSPETVVIDRDQLRFLVLALARLSPKPRTALLMNRCDGLSHAEIAHRMKISESMVAKHLAHALRHCRDHFRTLD